MVLYLSYYRNITFALVASSIGVAMQLGITAAIDHKNGGAAATQAMQSGYSDSTTKQYQATVGNSLLFGGQINDNNNSKIDDATQISSTNMNQTGNNQESAFFEEKHENIDPDWNQLMTDAAINGVVGGVTVAAGPLIESGISKLSSFVSKSFGFTDDAAELAATTMTKDEIVQAGMNNITAEKHIAKAINNLSSTPEKALNSVDNTVDILGELGKKALPDPINSMSKIVDNAVPDMTLGSNIKDLAKNAAVDGLDSGVAKPAFFRIPGVSNAAKYTFDNPAAIPGAVIGGAVGGRVFGPLGAIMGVKFGGELSKSLVYGLSNFLKPVTISTTEEQINAASYLLRYGK